MILNLYQFRLIIFFAASFCAPLASAYIPDYQMIMSRTAENHGRGIYVIEQDVVFRGDPDPLIVHETWWISGENAMRLNFEGRGALKGLVQGAFVYESNSKFWKEAAGSTKSARLSEDWFEPFFHFRFSKNIKPRMVALKMAPTESLKERVPQVTNKETLEFKYPQQKFVRLSRTGGTINYAIGTPTPVDDAAGSPGLWIEQDQFVVRKIRMPSQTVVTAEGYSRQVESLWLPKTRTVSWGTNSVQVHTAQVKHLEKSGGDNLKLSSIDVQKNPALVVRLPEQDMIREFYSRFR